LKKDLKEKDDIVATLTLLDARKYKYLKEVTELKERTRRAVVGCERPIIPFWACRECDSKDCFRLFLRMFLPRYGYGYLSKPTAAQWVTIREKILSTVDLTESSVNAKEEVLRRQLRTVEQSIQDSQTDEEDPITTAI
jgi:hypothetical protein